MQRLCDISDKMNKQSQGKRLSDELAAIKFVHQVAIDLAVHVAAAVLAREPRDDLAGALCEVARRIANPVVIILVVVLNPGDLYEMISTLPGLSAVLPVVGEGR